MFGRQLIILKFLVHNTIRTKQMERDLVVKFVEALRLNDIGAVLICDKKYGLVNFFDSSGSYKHYDVSVAVSQVSDRIMLLTLITSGYNVNGREYDNSTIFSRVIESEDLELIKLCLNNGGNIYHEQHPQDVLFKIISTGNKDIIESCLKSEQDKAKLLPLVNRALQYIFYIEQVPNTASDTWLADYQKNFLDITKLLLAHGANIDVTYQCYNDLENKYLEYTVLIDACTRGNVALVRALIIDCGADINRVTADTGPLHASINSLMIDVVRYLLDQPNIDFNQQILSTLDSPLHVASKKGDVRFIELLLDKGANKCIYNLMGQYPCDVAHESVGKYFHKILAVDSLVSVEES